MDNLIYKAEKKIRSLAFEQVVTTIQLCTISTFQMLNREQRTHHLFLMPKLKVLIKSSKLFGE